MTEAQQVEHNRLFEEAAALVKNEMQLHDRPQQPSERLFARMKSGLR
jgi:hypothetical protein